MTYNVQPLFGFGLTRRATPFDSTSALCKNMDTNDWFPENGAGRGKRYRAAKALCQRCPIREPCLQHGVETGAYGVWGGVSLRAGSIRKQCKKEKT